MKCLDNEGHVCTGFIQQNNNSNIAYVVPGIGSRISFEKQIDLTKQ